MCLFLKWREVRATTREPAPAPAALLAHLSYFSFEEKKITPLYSNQCLFVRRLLRVKYYLCPKQMGYVTRFVTFVYFHKAVKCRATN